jgi:hypothetical protein
VFAQTDAGSLASPHAGDGRLFHGRVNGVHPRDIVFDIANGCGYIVHAGPGGSSGLIREQLPGYTGSWTDEHTR